MAALLTTLRTSAVTSPLQISGLVSWWDMSDISSLWKDTGRTSAVTADGDIILGVTDKGSAGKHLSETTNGPTYKTAILNGKSVARFDGSNDQISNTAITADVSHTWFIVAKKRTAPGGGTQTLLGIAASATFFTNSGVAATGWDWFSNQAGASVLIGGTAANTSVLVGKITSAASMDVWADGGAAQNFDPNDGITTSTTVILGANSAGLLFGDFDIGEVLHYDTALGVADVNGVGRYLAARWGTTWGTAS